jgi:bifunctional UDP-N-acetylglucosamine pyrophosphorylase/glucosamine-1-phosphate N-acetyltransferase
MKNITAVVLAAGQGKRIEPIVTNKALLPFCGQPIIKWLVDDLKSAGINNIIVVVSPQTASDFRSALPAKINLAVQKKPAGMADALLSAKQLIKTPSIMVINGADILSPQAFKQFVSRIGKNNPPILLTGFKTSTYLAGGYFKLKSGKAMAIIEKPGKGKQPSPYFNIVLHYFQKGLDFIDILQKTASKQDDVYEVALTKLIKARPAELFKYNHYFGQIKYPFHILDVMNLFLNHRLKKKVEIHPTAEIMAGAVIKGPAYIGKNVIVGNNALIRHSTIEEGSLVGYNTEIARSYVGPNNFFHCNYLGDSVIEANSNLGSGARLANFRFDQKESMLKKGDRKIPTGKTKFGAVLGQGAKLGINASIMPGITIGANALIGAGVVLNHSVKPKEKVFHFHGS